MKYIKNRIIALAFVCVLLLSGTLVYLIGSNRANAADIDYNDPLSFYDNIEPDEYGNRISTYGGSIYWVTRAKVANQYASTSSSASAVAMDDSEPIFMAAMGARTGTSSGSGHTSPKRTRG